MVIAFWIIFSLILSIYIGYPFLLWVMGLFVKQTSKGSFSEANCPTVALVISAYNEEAVIREKMKNSLGLDYPKDKLEIIVASEANDGTNAIVKEFAQHGVKLFDFDTREGKAPTLQRVLPQLSADIIVFSDANAMYDAQAIKKLTRHFNDAQVGCVSGQLKYLKEENNNIGESEGAYWKYENGIKILESKLGSLLGANGSIFALRRELYLPIDYYRGDDFELPIKILIEGYKVVMESEALSFEKPSQKTKDEFKRKVRIISWNVVSACILFKNALRKGRLKVVFQLFFHKILRWFVGAFCIALLAVNIFLPGKFFFVFLLLQLFCYLLFFIALILDRTGRNVPKLMNIVYYFVLVNVASLMGLYKAIKLPQSATWDKARTG
jgi:poly-beta-1,6-N-acetyl-D-glucosamine synthase